MKQIWGKIGWFFVAMLPVLVLLTVQVGAALAVMAGYVVYITLNGGGGDVQEFLLSHNMLIVLVYQLIMLPIAGIWYYFAYGRKEKAPRAEKPSASGVLIVALLGVLGQVVVSALMQVVYILKPEWLQSYLELMKTAGITEFGILTLISVVIMAPVVEELTCRGLVWQLAKKVSSRFWVINIIQAFAFGLMHMNLVQGIYTFLLALLIGCICERYHRLWLCMLFHGVLNLSNYGVDLLTGMIPEQEMLPVMAAAALIGSILIAVCIKVMGVGRLPQEESSVSKG